MHTLDSSPVGLKYRCQWSPPLAIDWFDNSVYFGCQVLFRTRTRGQSWDVISPDLSTGDPSRILGSGGVVQDNLGQFYGALISAIAPSRTQQGVVWVGTNDGKVWISKNSGGAWTDLTKNFTMPPWGLVRRIDASHFDPATAYIAVDFHLVDIRDPYLFKTNDFGATWTRIDGGLPRGHPLDYTLSIAENPHRRGMVFAGTGHGFFYSLNDGQTWTQYKDKLPAAPVNWIEVPKNAAEVAVATYGRGLWILRDVWQLENADLIQQGDFQLLNPLPGLRTAGGTTASFVFSLRADPTGPITVEVLDPNEVVISTSQVTGRAGLNQVSSTLTYPGPGRIVMRSIPPDNPFIWDAGRWQGRERPVTHWGMGASTFQPRVAPGKYTVRMTYAGRQYVKPFNILRDVNLPSTDAELVAGTDIQRKIVAAINEVVDKTNRIEIMRAQVEDLRKLHAKNKSHDKALADIYKRMYDTELHFLSRTEMHSDDKWYVEAWGLYQNLVWLLAEVGSGGGDVMGGTSYGPTNATLSVFQDRVRDMEASRVAFDKLTADVAAFNTTYAGKIAAISDKMPVVTPPRQ